MSVADFEDLLKEQIGLDVGAIGQNVVARAVHERQAACKLVDEEAYLERVRTSAAELRELIEAVIVVETWFFRDPQAFALLSRHAVETWLPGHPDQVLRLLSIPCATGEEPYSMAIALLEAGVPDHRFTIHAVDISERAIDHARRALYSGNSFRGGDLGFRDRQFVHTPAGCQLSDAVRAKVSFRQGNLLAEDLMADAATYHAIFCRNVLIYFDPVARRRAIEILTRLLGPAGLLFVGPAETGLVSGKGFTSARVPLAFAFIRVEPALAARTPPVSARRAPADTMARPAPSPPYAARAEKRTAAMAPPPAPLIVDPGPRIDDAERLADAGRVHEASELCAEHLRRHGPSARALRLMGLLSEAAGKPRDAIGYHRKALYLEPDHEDTLLHLALLLQRQGDANAADVLRARARRHAPKGGR